MRDDKNQIADLKQSFSRQIHQLERCSFHAGAVRAYKIALGAMNESNYTLTALIEHHLSYQHRAENAFRETGYPYYSGQCMAFANIVGELSAIEEFSDLPK